MDCYCEWVGRRTRSPHPHRPDLDCPKKIAVEIQRVKAREGRVW